MDKFMDSLMIASEWAVPVLILIIPLIGIIRGVKIYEVFVEGAKEGFTVAVTIMPYLVAILVAIGMLRDVGAMEVFVRFLSPVTEAILMPAELLPLALMRPLSGSGAGGVLASILETQGPDSYVGLVASAMYGSTETTFYVLAVYFGAANIAKTRHAVIAGLGGDLAGALTACWFGYLFFGNLA